MRGREVYSPSLNDERVMSVGLLSNLLLLEGGKGDGRATPGPASFLHSEKVVRDAKSGGKLFIKINHEIHIRSSFINEWVAKQG